MSENTVELVGHFGDDITHALAAWTSTSRELDDKKRERAPALLKMLAEAGHHTPFEHSQFQFLVTGDIATHIQCLKHRIGVSINGESARYKELNEDRFYVPSDWHSAAALDKAVDKYVAHMERSFELYHELVAELTPALGRKRAKESARFVRPYGTQITWVMTFNFRSLMHFQGLRNSEHAQHEIRCLASKMLQLVDHTGKFKDSLAAFGWKGGRHVSETCKDCPTCGRPTSS